MLGFYILWTIVSEFGITLTCHFVLIPTATQRRQE